MKKSNHKTLIETGIESITILNNFLYASSKKGVYIISPDDQIRFIKHESEEHHHIYRLYNNGEIVFGNNMFGKTYMINQSTITEIKRKLILFESNGFSIERRNDLYFLIKDDKEILKLGDGIVQKVETYSNMAFLKVITGKRQSELVCYNLENLELKWKTNFKCNLNTIQEILFFEKNNVYVTGGDEYLYQINIAEGNVNNKFKIGFSNKLGPVPIGQMEYNSKSFIHPKLEFNIELNKYHKREFEHEMYYKSESERLEIYHNVLDYTFDNQYIYFQIHTYKDHHTNDLISQILQIERYSDKLISRSLVNPKKENVDAKFLEIIGTDLIIVDAHGELMKKPINNET